MPIGVGLAPRFCSSLVCVTTEVKQTVRVLEAGLACCGIEAAAVNLVDDALTHVDAVTFERVAVDHITVSGLNANVLIVAGTVTHALAPVIAAAYAELAEPKTVIAFGACAITGGPYWDSYSVIPGADHVIPVDIHVPGCPPTPQALAAALSQVGA